MKIVVLLSGIDSLIAKRKMEIDYPDAEIISVYYDYGQPYKDNDLASLPGDVEVRKFDLSPTSNQVGEFDINGRNMAAITLSCQWYQPDLIVCGFLYDEQNTYYDNDIIFCNLVSRTLQRIYKKSIKVISPYFDMRFTKSDAIEWALKNGFDEPELTKTVSCICVDEVGHQCGTCFKCFTRYIAFLYNGIDLRDQYDSHPFSDETNIENIIYYVNDNHPVYLKAMKFFLKLESSEDVVLHVNTKPIHQI